MALALDSVEGFSVFKSSKLKKEAASEENDQSVNELLEGKKEYYRQLEVFLICFLLCCSSS